MNLREWALPVYTIMIQLAVGALLFLWFLKLYSRSRVEEAELEDLCRIPLMIIYFTIGTAIFGAHFHLSKPLISVLAVSNFHSSWLSREIIFTVLFFLATGSIVALTWLVPGYTRAKNILGWLAITAGIATVFCMSQIYLLPTQKLWNSENTLFYYLGSTLLLGMTSLPAMLLLDLNYSEVQGNHQTKKYVEIVRKAVVWFSTASALVSVLVISQGIHQIITLKMINHQSAQASLELLTGLYQPLVVMRFGLLIVGVSWLLMSVHRIMKKDPEVKDLIGSIYVGFLLVLIGEILGRFLFYAAHVRIGV
ncbi:MAG: hypothetical protein DRI97_02465 [Bacteroidetes bacterium]|nr:MAG: hypothetical protein DRI97_02465 [Bacteroidota bacterium]RLE01676.1 MAG: hypothetical protein DRJ13_06590 [Bacteroidota bacterium]